MSRGEKVKVALDAVSIPLIAIYFVTVLFGGLGGLIGKDQASVNLSNFLLGMGAVGLILMIVSGVIAFHPTVDRASFMKQLTYITMTMAAFFALNIVVPAAVPFKMSLAESGRFVSVIIAIPEEILFRGWAAPYFGRKNKFMGALVSAAMFTVYHLFVFGTEPALLLIVFGAGFVAGLAVLKTGRLSTTLTTHILNNFIATGGI